MIKTGAGYIRDFAAEKEAALLMQALAPNTQLEVCRHFGCGKILSLEERLCGNRCKDHQQAVQIDITKFISY